MLGMLREFQDFEMHLH